MYTTSELSYLRGLDLSIKVQKTQTKIIEWCKHWNWDVYISFSGGKDSTVLLDLVSRVATEFGHHIPIVFCDTGVEYPEVRTFVTSRADVILRPTMRFADVVAEHGYPIVSKDVSCMIESVRRGNCPSFERRLQGLGKDGLPSVFCRRFVKWQKLLKAPFKISSKCCDILKKKPFLQYEKSSNRKPITGQMAIESSLRTATWLRSGCNIYGKRPISNPMSYWTEQDVLAYIVRFDIPIASVYGDIVKTNGKYYLTGEQRTGCMFCPIGVHLDKENRFQRMQHTHPKFYKYCIDTLKFGDVFDFLGVSYKSETLF